MALPPTAISLVGRTIAVIVYQGEIVSPELIGTIEEDTRSTLVVSIPSGTRTFLKDSLRCRIEGINEGNDIEGKDLHGKIHDRIKQIKQR